MKRTLLRDYFTATLSDWETIYERRTVYATIYQQRLRAALHAVDALQLGAGRVAIDIGCGPGLGSAALARRGFCVHTVDTSAEMLARTRERLRDERLQARGTRCDVGALSFAGGTFDLVFVVGVSEWLESLERPLAEIARVLAPGGHVVMTADNRWALSCMVDPLQHPLVVPVKRALGVLARRLVARPRPLRTHSRSRRTLDRALRQAGLTATSFSTLGYGPFTVFNRAIVSEPVGHALQRGLAALARYGISPLRSAGLVHVVVARKPAM